tara:strand:- start:18426 stop:19208 length:783 start_codon:yes stop_codon:yes gene_type:complete
MFSIQSKLTKPIELDDMGSHRGDDIDSPKYINASQMLTTFLVAFMGILSEKTIHCQDNFKGLQGLIGPLELELLQLEYTLSLVDGMIKSFWSSRGDELPVPVIKQVRDNVVSQFNFDNKDVTLQWLLDYAVIAQQQKASSNDSFNNCKIKLQSFLVNGLPLQSTHIVNFMMIITVHRGRYVRSRNCQVVTSRAQAIYNIYIAIAEYSKYDFLTFKLNMHLVLSTIKNEAEIEQQSTMFGRLGITRSGFVVALTDIMYILK